MEAGLEPTLRWPHHKYQQNCLRLPRWCLLTWFSTSALCLTPHWKAPIRLIAYVSDRPITPELRLRTATNEQNHRVRSAGVMLHRGNDDDCLHAPWSLPWCPWNRSRNLKFPHRVPLTVKWGKYNRCHCHFKIEAYRTVSVWNFGTCPLSKEWSKNFDVEIWRLAEPRQWALGLLP